MVRPQHRHRGAAPRLVDRLGRPARSQAGRLRRASADGGDGGSPELPLSRGPDRVGGGGGGGVELRGGRSDRRMDAHAEYDDRHPAEALEVVKIFATDEASMMRAAQAALRSLEYYEMALDDALRA